MIIDSHTHISTLPGTKFHEKSFEFVLAALLKEMKASKVDHAITLPLPEKDNQYGPDVAKSVELMAKHKNITILGTADPLSMTKSVLEKLDYWFSKKMISGLKLYPGYYHYYPTDKICHPLYKLCLKYDVPVIFHSGDTFGVRPPRLKHCHPFIFDDLAVDFPDLKIIIAHLGNPWLTDTAELLYKNKNIYADVSGLFYGDWMPGTRYGNLMAEKIDELTIFASAKKLLFGTDWPLAPMKDYIKFVGGLGFSKADLDLTMYKNAANLFKIKV